ncbi:MAG: hypothetical protein CBD44_00985 [Flavobacteriaceae bacterium TMED184]|nr:MAG: hypothetical protein CBD44_00985 [Flavobacteriaceae bacterium TMED184]
MYDLLNLNIYFDENYWLDGRKLFTKDIYQSSILNWYYRHLYRKQKPINNKFVKSGPQKLVNNILRAFINRTDVVFNNNIYDNYYFCTYSQNNKNQLLDILEEKNKVIVGPLYSIDNFLELVEFTYKYNNLRIVCASYSAKKTMLKIANFTDQKDIIKVLPVGISSSAEILKNKEESKSNIQNDCLIYLKGRKKTELDSILKALDSKNLSYEIFVYGKYNNSRMVNIAKASKFGIVWGRTESQGIGINELMSTNLPLFIIDSSENYFNNQVYEGTSVPYWNDACGIKIDSIDYFDKNFSKFLIDVKSDKYQPYKLIIDQLSYEAMSKNLVNLFKNISS